LHARVAHDPSHPELNEWFNWLASGKGLCCSFADGFVVSDVDWESKDGTTASVSKADGSTFPTMP
jgi:hypothetical protein